MQTFLPSPIFPKSAALLDRQRLGKQRIENLQIMRALFEGRGWTNHPAVKMWRGYEWALYMYQEAICLEWQSRGYRDTCLDKTQDLYFHHRDEGEDRVPKWIGWLAFHASHQSNLIRKDPAYYRPLFPGIPDDLPYIWPIEE